MILRTNARRSAWPFLLVALLMTASLGVSAAGRAEPPATPPQAANTRQVVDDLATEMLVPTRPQRIFSVSLFSDEVLFALVDSERLAAITPIAQNPIYSNVAGQAAVVEPVIDFAAEQVIAADPDLVIAADWSEADTIGQLRSAGIPVYQVATPTTLAGIAAAIEAIGALVDEADAATALVEDMDDRIDAMRERTAGRASAERLTALDYNTWGTASGGDTTWQIVLDLAGIANAAADLGQNDFGQVPMSRELVVELDPDMLFLPGYVWGDDGAAEAFEASVRDDAAFSGITAVREDRVFLFPEQLKGTYSHYILDAADLAWELAYGDPR